MLLRMLEQIESYTKALAATTNRADLYAAIVNAPYTDKVFTTQLGLGICVLLLKNTETNTLDRIALSDTELANGAVRMSAKPFHEIKIPLDAHDNFLIKTIASNTPQLTNDWYYLFTPVLTAQEARFNQYGAGIEFSATYPLYNTQKQEVIGAMIFSYFSQADEDMTTQREFMQSITMVAANYL